MRLSVVVFLVCCHRFFGVCSRTAEKPRWLFLAYESELLSWSVPDNSTQEDTDTYRPLFSLLRTVLDEELAYRGEYRA